MRSITLMARSRNAFDNTLSKGTIALIAWLFILSALFILGTAAIVTITGIAATREESPDYFELTWRSLLRTLDPGTMGGDAGRPEFLGAMLIVALGGTFIVSTLMGVLTSGSESKLEELRKGDKAIVIAES